MDGLPDLLKRFWGIQPDRVQTLASGMNSQTWRVEHQGSTYVAKAVAPPRASGLVDGCAVAASLAETGPVTGRPITTTDGRLVVDAPALALLEYVPGRELRGDTDEEQHWMATTLAAVHTAGGPVSGVSTATFARWLSPEFRGVGAHRR